jgi:NAD(P)-dependent dehydrogenase (short-subunit alcohol dehydrogenase family)
MPTVRRHNRIVVDFGVQKLGLAIVQSLAREGAHVSVMDAPRSA